VLNFNDKGPVSRYDVFLLRVYILLEEWKMNKYLIEVSQGSYKISNMRASYIFKRSGSHFVTHAEWGYLDGKYKAWLVAETEDEKEAMRILPSAYRQSAKIILLNKFSR
jgi:hypothetical protein